MIDRNGETIQEGDMLATPRINGLRYIDEVSLYDGSLLKPYIYRQVGDGELEVVGRLQQETDYSKLTKITHETISA